nr:hypothetical protein [Comamonas fluminis]
MGFELSVGLDEKIEIIIPAAAVNNNIKVFFWVKLRKTGDAKKKIAIMGVNHMGPFTKPPTNNDQAMYFSVEIS